MSGWEINVISLQHANPFMRSPPSDSPTNIPHGGPRPFPFLPFFCPKQLFTLRHMGPHQAFSHQEDWVRGPVGVAVALWARPFLPQHACLGSCWNHHLVIDL